MDGHRAWAGVFPAVLTMFDADGRLDDDATARHIDRLIQYGAHGVVVGGTSGEFISLDDAERRRLIEVGVQAAAGRVPVIAGTGHASTRHTIELTEHAARVGANGAIVILPYYQRPTELEVVAHFRVVGRASPLPVMLYNNPANSGAPPLDTAQIRALYEEGLGQAVKSTFPTVHQVHELRAELDDGFRVFYGSFMAPIEGFAGGAHGWISGILNVVTRDAVRVWDAMRVGDLAAARAAYARILPIRLLYSNPQGGATSDLAIYRAILRLRGQDSGHCRAPLLDLTASQVETVRARLEPLGLVPAA
jgi:4-hydroxy-tetrahydrodipicolinate synthase